MNEKKCHLCKEIKEISFFEYDYIFTLSNVCKTCHDKFMRRVDALAKADKKICYSLKLNYSALHNLLKKEEENKK